MRIGCEIVIKLGVNGIIESDIRVIIQFIMKSLFGYFIGLNKRNKYPIVVPKKLIPSNKPKLIDINQEIPLICLTTHSLPFLS